MLTEKLQERNLSDDLGVDVDNIKTDHKEGGEVWNGLI